MKKKNIIFGACTAILALAAGVVGNLSSDNLSARILPYSQQASGDELFIPNDFITNAGEIGEIVVKAGDSFPEFAREEVIGLRLTVEWEKNEMDFLGATLKDTLFDTSADPFPDNGDDEINPFDPYGENGTADFDISVTHDPVENTANIMVWTGGEVGTFVSAGDDLVRIPFEVSSYAELGDEMVVRLVSAEVAYDMESTKSYTMTKLQEGVLRVGNPDDPELLAGEKGELFFEKNILAKPGEERTLALRTSTAKSIAGVLMDVHYPQDKMTFLGVETQGTALQGQGFHVMTNVDITNHIGILGITGKLSGAVAEKNDPIMLFRFLVHNDVALGSVLPITIEKSQMVDAETLEIIEQEKTEGSLSINAVSSLQVVDALPLSSSSVRIVFSDDVVGGNLSDIRFTPKLKNENTTMEIEGKSVVLRDLTTMIPDTSYRVDMPESIVGSLTGTLSPEYNFAFFKGFPSQYPISKFYIEKIEATSSTGATITFSEAVNPLSIEPEDFAIDGLTISSATGSGNTVTLATSPQSILAASSWLTVENRSQIHDPKSVNEELLSKATAPFIPYGYTPNGPQITEVKAEKEDVVIITFDTALLGSSLAKSAFSITEVGRSGELITAESFYELSPDHTVVTFHKVRTLASRNYSVRVLPGTLESVSGTPIEAFGNIESFFGQSSFFTPWDFGMESAESVSESQIQVVFSEDVDAESVDINSFEIWTRNDGDLNRELNITAVEVEGNAVILSTEAQKENVSYFVLTKPQTVQSTYGEILGVPNGRGVQGYSAAKMRVVSVSPSQLNVGEGGTITLTGANFPEGVVVRIGGKEVTATRISETEIQIEIPTDTSLDASDIVVVSPNGEESTLAGGLLIIDPEREEKLKPVILSEESYATPYRVPNDGMTETTLWVKIEDPRGVQDIEKVTADLRSIGGPAAAAFSLFHLDETESPETEGSPLQEERWDEGGTIWKEVNDMAFVDGKAWYFLKVKVPPTVPTSLDPTLIPVTVENKTGRTAFGTVEVLVNRDIYESIPPTIESATAMPPLLVPGDATEVTFQAEIEDADGGGNVMRVVLDATKVGLGILVLQPLEEIQEDRQCERTDYEVTVDWTDCIDGKRTRVVELKTGVICDEIAENKPREVMDCVGGACQVTDWVEAGWGECYQGRQKKEYEIRDNSTCTGGNEPADEYRDCDIKNGAAGTDNPFGFIMDYVIPKAHALSVFGNRIWFESEPQNIPSWVPEGSYKLPLTVIDREGTEVKGTISIQIARDAGGTPSIDKDDIYVSPKHSVPNDEKTPFRIFAKVTDPNGHADIESVSVNLSEIGLYPVAMQKGQIEGAGAWYFTEEHVIPRRVIPGYRTLDVSATDTSGNSTKTGFTFHVSTPQSSGDEPEIVPDKSYSNPRAFINDQKSRGTLYVYVEEGDAPISHVSANLGTILQYVGSDEGTEDEDTDNTAAEEDNNTPRDPFAAVFLPLANAENVGGEVGDATIPSIPGAPTGEEATEYGEKVPECVSTDTFGCMTHSVAEGARGHWFHLSDLIVRENVPASQNPYYISVVATDTDGRRAEQDVPVYVSDGILPLTYSDLPYLVSAVATERNEVQAYFSASIDPSRITKDDFVITMYDDIHSKLPIKSIDIRSDGRVVTLTTSSMNEGDTLTLFADSDALGLRQTQLTDNQADFEAKTKSQRNESFEIEEVDSLNPNALELIFTKEVLFNSFETDGSNFSIVQKGTGEELEIYGAQLQDQNEIVLSTDFQIPGAEYILRVDSLLDYTGDKLRQGTDIVVFTSDADYGNNPFVITKRISKDVTTVGESVDFTITISNENSDESIHDVTLVDIFSSDILQVLSIDTGEAFSCGNTDTKIACHITEIPPGVKYEVRTTFKAVAGGIGTNTIMAVYDAEKEVVDDMLKEDIDPEEFLDEYDIEKSILSSANIVVVDPGNPFLIRKTPDKVEAGVNEEVNFTISITNRTPAQHFTNVNIVDDFPEHLIKLVEVTPLSELSCSNDASTITCDIPLFEPGETYSFVAKYIALAEGLVTNTAVATVDAPPSLSDGENVAEGGTSTGAGSANLYIQNPFLNADFNVDTRVDFLDFSIFASSYGASAASGAETDLNRDGRVDFLDFSIFSQQYGVQKENAPIRIPEHKSTPQESQQNNNGSTDPAGETNPENGGEELQATNPNTGGGNTNPGAPVTPPLP